MVQWVSPGQMTPKKGRAGRARGEKLLADSRDPMALRGKSVVVIGAGRSGLAAAKFLCRRGARVVMSDRQGPEGLGDKVEMLEKWGAKIAPAGHPEKILQKADFIVLSPGVPGTIGPLNAARAQGIPILGEVELAARHLRAPLIGITGTNGKSTTTTFMGQLLRGVGHRVFVGGNLGVPLIEAVDEENDLVVAELSSFQLETVENFHAHGALLLNISEDHLSRYENFEHYAKTKGRLFINQDGSDFVVVNARDALAVELAEKSQARTYYFSSAGPVERGAYCADGQIFIGEKGAFEAVSLQDFKPRGSHNIENLMAALLACNLAGYSVEQLAWCIKRLEGLPHRMEWAGEIGGVTYYNDSKATNVASVVASLSGMNEPLVVLLGGVDKGGSYAALKSVLAGRARKLLLFGEARHQMQAAFEGVAEIEVMESLDEAVQGAFLAAQPGDSVVLSPACSSYDQFSNYIERGQRFRQLVSGLESREGGSQ